MANHPIITHKLLRQLVRFSPETNQYFWNPRPREMFKAEGSWKSWNTNWANKETFNAVDGRGYCQAVVLLRHYNAHRIIWFYHYGVWPDGEIDHINGIPTDNRIENLRVVTSAENSKNLKLRADNKSGATGVSWNPCSSTWRVRIRENCKTIEIGSFTKIDAAIAARKAAEIKYKYHPNHGRS